MKLRRMAWILVCLCLLGAVCFSQVWAAEAEEYVGYDEAVALARTGLVSRQETVTVYVRSDAELSSNACMELYNLAISHTGVPNEGDYIRRNMSGCDFSTELTVSDGVYYYTFTLTPNWLSTAEQEAQVDAAVQSLLNELALWDATNYEKITGVYNWITENVQYDFDNLDDDTYTLKYTTYSAIIQKNTVCQGYATLLYRLLLSLDVDCRLISGMADNEHHAWNIVYLDGKYYNVDATWDRDLMGHYRYFLCTEDNFGDHTRDTEFTTSEFKSQYPMAIVPYVFNVAASGTVNSAIAWVLDGDTGTLTVAGTGAIPSYRYSYAPWYSYRESVKSIVVSEGITEVGERAFYWCTNCTSVELPSTLVAIREYGFNNLRALQYITLPENLQIIEFCAFSECAGLKSITIPDSVHTVGSSAFSNCPGLTSATLGAGMKTVPSSMFFNDPKLYTVVLPEGITSIGNTAFSSCGLRSFHIPSTLTSLGSSALSGCSNLTSITVATGNPAYKSVNGVLFTADGKTLLCYPAGKFGSYTVPAGTEVIASGAFRGTYYLTGITFCSTLREIGDYSFSYCSLLNSVTFPANVTLICDSAFRSCTNLCSVTFQNDSVTLESGGVFAECDSLVSITLPQKITEIPGYLFYGCAKLRYVTIPSTATKIGSSAFLDCDSLTSITIPGNVRSIGRQAFDFCNKLTTITIEEGVTRLEDYCIRNAPALTKVVIPDSLTSIGKEMFDACPNVVLYVNCGSYGYNYAISNGRSYNASHPYTVSKVITPTCTTQGYTVRACKCGLSSYNTNYVSALGHSYDPYVTNATCTSDGYTTYVCFRCDDSYIADYVDAMGHSFEPWYTVQIPSAAAPGVEQRECTACGFTESRDVEGSWQKYDLAGHMSELPERLCSGANLWPVLNREKLYFYDGTQWGTLDDVHSVTIAVTGGDRIAATSFSRGIRVTYFDDYGVLESVSSTDIKAEYAQNGFITVPEGAVAVNIPMWDGSDGNELYLLSYPHEKDNITVVPPSCTQQGYTGYTCPICEESFREDLQDALEHDFADGRCTLCGLESIRVGPEDIGFYQGGVDAVSGTLNTTFTNNWYANIRIPEGASQVRFLTFKTNGNWGSAFLRGNTYLSGYSDKTTGGQWVTLDIPEGADVLRYGYLYDEIAQKNGYPLFEYVEFLGQDMEPVPPSQFLERPVTGCHAFQVEVNIAAAMGDPDGYVAGTDYGYIVLPTSYTSYGEPTRLIIVCHGAGASLSTYQSDAKKTTNYTFWTDLGYAVMDMYACPTELSGSDTCLHFGNPAVLECYKQGYDYVMEHFNLKQDGIYVIGSSMGGLSSFQIVQSGEFPVIAQVGYCPVIDLHKQAYNNPWTTPSYQRQRIAQYFDFEGTQPTFTSTKFPSAAEIAYFRENLDKVKGYSPILRNVVSGDPDSLFQVNPSSAVGFDETEAALYAQLTATHPCPVMIFHNLDDSTVAYRYSLYFKEMVERSGQEVILYTFETGGHNAWANGTNTTVQGLNGSVSLKTSQYEAYLFFQKFEDHLTHQPWVDPAVAATCTETGLTQGEHCAVCGEILTAQEETPDLGHTPGDAVKENEGAHGSHEKVVYCSACGEELSREYDDGYVPGDITGDGEVNNKDLTRLFRYLSGYDVQVQTDALDVNGDGLVSNKDLTRLFRHLSGYDVEIH